MGLTNHCNLRTGCYNIYIPTKEETNVASAKTKSKEITITITIEDDQIFELLEENDIKPSQAKVNKLKKLFAEVESDYYEQFEEVFFEALKEIAEEEWGQ